MAKKKKKKATPKRPSAPARFAIGASIRVKPGTKDPEFPDIPIGGWSGTVTDEEAGREGRVYLIQWDQRTRNAMHPVFLKRCQRDGLEPDETWLSEDDIELDTGEPLPIEQPTQIITRPLKLNDQDDRIRSILGLTSDDPMPEANRRNLHKYHEYLAEKLSFPFSASYEEETEPFQSQHRHFMVTSLHDPEDCDEEDGLLCKAQDGDDEFEVPLAQIEAASGPNRRLVEDYAYWFANWSSEGGDEEDEEPEDEPRGEVTHVRAGAEPGVTPKGLRSMFIQVSLQGGCYGIVLGASLASLEEAAVGAKVGALLLALLGGLLGSSFGKAFGMMNRLPSGPFLGGVVGAGMGGGIGALLGVMLVAFKGTLLGGLVGGILGRLLSTQERPFRAVKGVIGGALLGVVVQAWLILQRYSS